MAVLEEVSSVSCLQTLGGNAGAGSRPFEEGRGLIFFVSFHLFIKNLFRVRQTQKGVIMTANERKEVDRQFEIIMKGVSKVSSEEELLHKLETAVCAEKPLRVKFGMDPSAPDVHLGHSVPLRKLRQMQEMGHEIIIIIGDFTGRIGDPTGKSKGRKAMTDREILVNAQTYQEQIFRILDPGKTQVRFNGEWLELLNLEEILRLAATTTVARMLERDDFHTRFTGNTPIGLHEFFYPLMQAYDSVALEADIELGGTDQTFNILMGRNLQKDMGMEPQAAIFMPLLVGLDGTEKMSKSLGNYIGVEEEAKTMFRKVMEIPDSLILTYFELTTDVLPCELDDIRKKLEEGCNPKEIKLLLAKTITGLYHSREETSLAEHFFEEAFTQKTVPQNADILFLQRPNVRFADLGEELMKSGRIDSKNQFRRMIQQGGVQRNGVRITSGEEILENGDAIKIGKKQFLKVVYRLSSTQ